MSHLNPSEFVDFIEGQLARPRARHLESCGDCRAQAEAARDALGGVRADAMPEPSPLFWDHLTARIGEALDNEPVPAPSWGEWLRGRHLAAAAVAMLLVASIAAYGGWSWRSATIENVATSARGAAEAPLDDIAGDVPGDEAWNVIAAAAQALDYEDARVGIAPRSGASERVMLELNAEERAELKRLIEDEMRSGS